MSFLTLFIVSCLFYIVEPIPINQSQKIKECSCKEKLDSFHKEAIYTLYSNGENPVEYKNLFDNYKKNMLQEIEPTGIDSGFLQQELDLLLNKMSAKASSDTGLSVTECKLLLDDSMVKVIQFINSPEFKAFGSKAKLASFSSDLKTMLENVGLKSENFLEVINKFVGNVLKIVVPAGFDPYLLNQELNELKKQLSKIITPDGQAFDLLKETFQEFLKDLTKIIEDPEFSKLTIENHMDNFKNDIYTAIEANLMPLMSELKLKPEDQEYYKGLGKETLMGYIRYLFLEIIEVGQKGPKTVAESDADNDILVDFPVPDNEPEDDEEENDHVKD